MLPVKQLPSPSALWHWVQNGQGRHADGGQRFISVRKSQNGQRGWPGYPVRLVPRPGRGGTSLVRVQLVTAQLGVLLVPLVCLVAMVGADWLPSLGVVVSLRLFVSPVVPA